MDKSNMSDGEMDEFFDDLLSEDQRKQFLSDRREDESFRRHRDLQDRINDALVARFSMDVDEEKVLGPVMLGASTVSRVRVWNRRTWAIGLAATIVGLFVYGLVRPWSADHSPVFETQSLVTLYQQELVRGFKPYYECHDMVRFADTFEHRLGVPLTLAEMPEDREMLGISYLGGLSRMTVAMLCQVKGEPVVVFVDLQENRNSAAAISGDSSCAVFSTERSGMVFYEVTPHSEPNMMEYFLFPKP